MKMSVAAKSIGAEFVGSDTEFFGVNIDSRKVEKDNLFVALKGPNHDAHEYIDQADTNGAVGFVVEKKVSTAKPQMMVPNTRLALGRLAATWRKKLTATQFVGVTGSNGKTTVKEMIAAILSACGNTIATKGNLNNDIGMPLTLLSIDSSCQYAVIEMGANHAKEIDYLAGIVKPNVALVNNAGSAHLEGFGSIEGVAKAKGEIYSHIEANGIAVINFDDQYADYWISLNQNNKILTFSFGDKNADIVGVLRNKKFFISYKDKQVEINLPLSGKHNVCNAIAATAVSVALDVSLNDVKYGLESFKPVGGRLQDIQIGDGNIIIDDTYNANPSSFKAAIDVLQSYQKEACLIMGDMTELGSYADNEHIEVGQYAKQNNIQQFYCYGLLSKKSADSFGKGALHFSTKLELINYIKNNKYKDTVFLVKGSRSMAMEEVVEFLKKHLNTAET